MDFKLDSLQLITHCQDRTLGSVVCQPTWLIVDRYSVPDDCCSIACRYFIILSNGHYIARALLTLSMNGARLLLQLGDIITIIKYGKEMPFCHSKSVFITQHRTTNYFSCFFFINSFTLFHSHIPHSLLRNYFNFVLMY